MFGVCAAQSVAVVKNPAMLRTAADFFFVMPRCQFFGRIFFFNAADLDRSAPRRTALRSPSVARAFRGARYSHARGIFLDVLKKNTRGGTSIGALRTVRFSSSSVTRLSWFLSSARNSFE